MNIVVHLGEQSYPAGTALDSPDKLVDMTEAMHSMDRAVQDGLFTLRDRAEWQFQTLYRSEEDWLEFRDKPNCGGIEADTQLLDAAFALPDGFVLLSEENFASVYETLEAC